MKRNKGNGLKKVLIFLSIVLISMISFVGIYVKDANKTKNIIPEYLTGADLKGYRVLKLKVDDSTNEIIKDSEGKVVASATEEEIKEKGYTKTTEPVNNAELLTRENYLLSRRIIEKRLNDLQISDYKVRQNMDDGSILVELNENMSTDNVISNILTKGKFEMQDDETKEVLLNNDNIKTGQVLYNTTTGTTIYLSIEFDKEGRKKLEEISKTYVSTTDSEGKTTEKKVSLLVDDDVLLSTSFSTTILNGKLQLSMGNGSKTDADSLNEYVQQAQNMAVILKNGNMPLAYTSETNKYIQTPVNEELVKTILIVAASVLAVMMLTLVIRFKGKGLLAAISHVGINALILLAIRYTNVEIGLGGLIALGLVQLINYILLVMMLKENKTVGTTKKAIVKFAYRIIPAYIISIVFTFTNFLPTYSFGMTIFWAITIIFIYNSFVTRNLIENSEEK